MDGKDLQSTARQIRHQMIALNNKDFVPACFYGLPGLHDGEQVQLSLSANNGEGVGVRPLRSNYHTAYNKLV